MLQTPTPAWRPWRSSRRIGRFEERDEAGSAFLALVDKGSIGPKAAMAGTPYA
ncbi:hypothetical protein X769_12265 [Mesorhizobium sp. LSJC268A00]|uniref:hypothetical protein n=1 Tax=unclassified Mesorhizobium TaxID=325217 RepID=UPI0003CEE6D0|nr:MULTISPECIES: hypothetical protein [unclassified Mesorhizobium]ESX04832.1 hypothetical protein X769_12265 [Mesorhizobium sp. LSJC268A00]ESZ14690.1 hypothetical protein X735_13935 [Mesorhizobium sp. L2C085B000]